MAIRFSPLSSQRFRQAEAKRWRRSYTRTFLGYFPDRSAWDHALLKAECTVSAASAPPFADGKKYGFSPQKKFRRRAPKLKKSAILTRRRRETNQLFKAVKPAFTFAIRLANRNAVAEANAFYMRPQIAKMHPRKLRRRIKRQTFCEKTTFPDFCAELNCPKAKISFQ